MAPSTALSKTTKTKTDDAPAAPALATSTLPPALRFPLVVVLSLTLSSLLYSLAATWTGGELASVARRPEGWGEVGVLVAWKGVELAVGWYGNYDGYDLVALSVLSHGPPLYLLGNFYGVSQTALLSSLAIDCLTTYIPFRLLRPLSRAHAATASTSKEVAVPNREILADLQIQAVTTMLASAIYSVTLYSAYASYLPLYLVAYFTNLPSIEAAHSATPTSLFPVSILLGLAAKSLIFTPAIATVPSLADAKSEVFNPATATLTETFQRNMWSFDPRTKVVIQRTLTLMAVSGVNIFLQTFVTLEGVEFQGAAAYAGVFMAAAGIAGTVLGVVSAV